MVEGEVQFAPEVVPGYISDDPIRAYALMLLVQPYAGICASPKDAVNGKSVVAEALQYYLHPLNIGCPVYVFRAILAEPAVSVPARRPAAISPTMTSRRI